MNADEVKAIVSEALARQKAESAAELLELKEKLEFSNHWARDLKVKQEQAKFREPADKKAIGYLCNEKLDLDEASNDFMSMFGDESAEDGINTTVTEANKEAVSNYLRKHFLALGKRIRFNKRETESYHVALASPGGWKTEKKYRADSIFASDDSTPWHLKPEPSTEKKMENFRRAESDVQKELAMKKVFNRSDAAMPYARRPSRWDYRSLPTHASSFNAAGPSGFVQGQNIYANSMPPPPYPPASFVPLNQQNVYGNKDGCWKCGEQGHNKYQCPKK